MIFSASPSNNRKHGSPKNGPTDALAGSTTLTNEELTSSTRLGTVWAQKNASEDALIC